MKPTTGLTVAQQQAPVLENEGDVFRPLFSLLAKYQKRAAYLKNFSPRPRRLPKNVKVVPARQEPGQFYSQAADAVLTLIYQ